MGGNFFFKQIIQIIQFSFFYERLCNPLQQNQARHATPLPCHSTIPYHAKLVYKVTH